MPNWLKISLFILVLALICLGAVFAIKLRELPPAATVEFINIALAEDLEILRQIARDSSNAELGFDFSDIGVIADDGAQMDEHLAALDDHLAAITPLDDRVGDIDNPIIVFISLQHSVDAKLNSYSFNINSGDYIGEEAPFSERATLGNPVVSRMLGINHSGVRYSEVVSTDDNLEISFELHLDLDLLKEKYAEMNPQ